MPNNNESSPPSSAISRKPKDASVDPGIAAKLFAQEAEYYQDIHYTDSSNKQKTRILVDVMDALAIGTGSTVLGDDFEQIKIFTESLVLLDFSANAAKNLLISCNAITSSNVGNSQNTGINVTPKSPADFDTPQLDGDGQAGNQGQNAGNIVLYLESIDENNPRSFPRLTARGGHGQNGQLSQNGKGGAPGYGGNGGDITVVYVSPYRRAIVTIQQALLSLDGSNARKIISTLQSIPNQGILLMSGDSVANLIDSSSIFMNAIDALLLNSDSDITTPNSHDEMAKILIVTNTLSDCITTFQTHIKSIESSIIYPNILNGAGDTANYGTGPKGHSSGAPNGSKPTDGKIIVHAVSSLLELPWKSDTEIDCYSLISDMQSAMLLQKAKMAYFYGDVSEGGPAKQTAAAAKIFLDRLVDRLAFVEQAKIADDNATEASALNRLRSVNNEARAYQNQFSLALDYYGHPYGQVPLLSLERYQSMVDSLIKSFSIIEANYAEYFTYLIENKAEMSQLKTASSYLQALNDQLGSDQQVLRESAGRIAYDISCMSDLLEFKRQALDKAIKALNQDINSYFNFDFKALLSGLSVVAFAPKSAAMWATQAGSWLYNGATTIPNNSGEAINKDYVVQQVLSVQASVDGLSEGFKQVNGGLFEVDDPGANKLIAAEADLKKLIDNFQTQFKDDVKSIEDAFNDYVTAVIERNNKILSYNAMVSLILKKNQEVADNEAHQKDIQTQMSNDADPALPAITSSMSVFYHSTRDQLMELLYQMVRAYQFRALSNTNLIAKYMSEQSLTPATMTTSTISTMYASSDSAGHLQNGIAWEWYKAQENMGQFQTSRFPQSDKAFGAQYRFDTPEILETFKQLRTLSDDTQIHSVMLNVPAVYRNTPSNATDLSEMSDIRLTNVRAWLDGVKIVGDSQSDPKLNIDVIHTGNETIVNPSNELFSFKHAQVMKIFKYSPDLLPEDPAVFPSNAIFSDSDIPRNDDQPTYALIGPFSGWEVRLTNTYSNKIGILDEIAKGHVQALTGKSVTCNYPSRSPIVGTIGRVSQSGSVLTLEILNIIKRVADVLEVKNQTVTSKIVMKGDKFNTPNQQISFAAETQGAQLDFTNFTAIRLEFCGTGRGFSIS